MLNRDDEISSYKGKAQFFIVFNVLIMLVTAIAFLIFYLQSGLTCAATQGLLSAFIVVCTLSLCFGLCMMRQISKGYLSKWLMILNFILDWGLFAVGIWEIIFLAKYKDNCGVGLTTAEIVVGSLLCVLTFVRVYYILLILLFPVFILPCYYMPDCCPCKKCVMGG